jgi:rRNA-processing protein FCF1
VAARQLSSVVTASDVDRLVLNAGHSRVIASFPLVGQHGAVLAINELISFEYDQRIAQFNAVKEDLAKLTYWTQGGQLVVFDTNIYMHAAFKLRDIPFAKVLGSARDVHLILPMIVIDELDQLKQHHDKQRRWRAMYTLGVIDDVIKDPLQPGALLDSGLLLPPPWEKGPPVQRVTMQVVLDPAGHVRLPIADDEIVDRAQAVQSLAGRPVSLVTSDTGMKNRVRAAGLNLIEIKDEAGPEPEPQISRRDRAERRGETPANSATA